MPHNHHQFSVGDKIRWFKRCGSDHLEFHGTVESIVPDTGLFCSVQECVGYPVVQFASSRMSVSPQHDRPEPFPA